MDPTRDVLVDVYRSSAMVVGEEEVKSKVVRDLQQDLSGELISQGQGGNTGHCTSLNGDTEMVQQKIYSTSHPAIGDFLQQVQPVQW